MIQYKTKKTLKIDNI